MKINRVLESIERLAPLKGSASWDKSGVQIAGVRNDISKVALMLDPLPEQLAKALDWGADLVLTHHPLSMTPRFLDRIDAFHQTASLILGAGAWLYAAHTSLDANPNGPAGWLAAELELSGLEILEPTFRSSPQAVCFDPGPLPRDVVESWKGLPLVLDLQSTEPNEFVLVCLREDWPTLKALISKDLSSSPSFMIMDLPFPDKILGFGMVGDLPAPMPWKDFSARAAQIIPTDSWTVCGPAPESVGRVAYCTGSGGALINKAARAGADVFITGDVKYHDALEARTYAIDVGHFVLEEEMMKHLAKTLANDQSLSGLEFIFMPGCDPLKAIQLRDER